LLHSEALATTSEAEGVLPRLMPFRAAKFVLEEIPQENGNDVFELESHDGKIVIG